MWAVSPGGLFPVFEAETGLFQDFMQEACMDVATSMWIGNPYFFGPFNHELMFAPENGP